MHFRNLTHADLEAPMDLPGLRDWIGALKPTDVALLILAPAGSGKSAAVGHIAHRRGEAVMLCNLMEVLEAPEPEQQLASLLIACETQREELCYLDKLDRLLETWDRQRPDRAGRLAEQVRDWLERKKPVLVERNDAVVFTGRKADAIPESLRRAFDQVFGL
jgi:ATPase family protein associated with various cellular activities (AAA)